MEIFKSEDDACCIEFGNIGNEAALFTKVREEFTANHVFETHKKVEGGLKGQEHIDDEGMSDGGKDLSFRINVFYLAQPNALGL
jgi:hypothetical protein